MATATDQAAETEVSIMGRILCNEDGQLSPDLARYFLDLKISEKDRARMHDLAVRNQADGLNAAEKEELFAFVKATSLLSIFKSRARRVLGVKLELPVFDTSVLD